MFGAPSVTSCPAWVYITSDMAIAVAHDVSQYYNSRGSSTFKCSLDAERAFDHIPHSVIFDKLDGTMPDQMWRLLYSWYDLMYGTIRLNGSLGRRLDVRRCVRQGSIISPWIFNCFYRDMVTTINDMECGLIIGNNRYNVI